MAPAALAVRIKFFGLIADSPKPSAAERRALKRSMLIIQPGSLGGGSPTALPERPREQQQPDHQPDDADPRRRLPALARGRAAGEQKHDRAYQHEPDEPREHEGRALDPAAWRGERVHGCDDGDGVQRDRDGQGQDLADRRTH
jgi:hypothetical protein